MKTYRFKAKVYKPPFAPFYDAYKGHIFTVDHRHMEDHDHIWLMCIDDPSVLVDGYVEMCDLEQV